MQFVSRRGVLAGGLAIGACAHMPDRKTPLVIGHRGASADRPEHTIGSYRLAIAQGADFIEPDLVCTRDQVLVCRHENEISGTTDVSDHAEFADRRVRKSVDGVEVEGWFTEDFTLDELRTLRCRERLPELRPQNTAYNDQEQIPTLTEVLELARAEGVGIYPELKHPSYFAERYFLTSVMLKRELERVGWDTPEAPVFVQCFEPTALMRWGARAGTKRVLLLSAEGGPWDFTHEGLSYRDMLSDAGLGDIARYAHAIGVEKTLVFPRDADGRTGAPSDLVDRAHAVGLQVHVWTCRPENYFLPTQYRRGDATDPSFLRIQGDAQQELRDLFTAGVDGVFCDRPRDGVAARA